MDQEEALRKYEELSQRLEQTQAQLKEAAQNAQDLARSVEEEKEKQRKLEEENRFLREEVEQLNISVQNFIKDSKQLKEVCGKYEKLKQEYARQKKKIEERDSHIIDLESSTRALVETYEKKIQQLELKQGPKVAGQEMFAQTEQRFEEERKTEKQEEQPLREIEISEKQASSSAATRYFRLFLLSLVSHPIFFLLYRNKLRKK